VIVCAALAAAHEPFRNRAPTRKLERFAAAAHIITEEQLIACSDQTARRTHSVAQWRTPALRMFLCLLILTFSSMQALNLKNGELLSVGAYKRVELLEAQILD
jgi:hypothetical protein